MDDFAGCTPYEDPHHPNNPNNSDYIEAEAQEENARWYAENGYSLEETLENAPDGWEGLWKETWENDDKTALRRWERHKGE